MPCIHCYNTATCDVCAYDPPGPAPVWPIATPGGSIQDCQQCHAAGPVTAKTPFHDGVNAAMKDINTTCAKLGGARWIGTTWVPQDRANNVPAPGKCGSCHSEGFVKGARSFCDRIVKPAFGTGGAMAGKRFDDKTDKATCEAFARAMGCAADEFRCSTR